jgi:hypothetical protein
VTATEVIVAFGFLFMLALLSVAFGLAVSSMMERARGAILATLLLSFPISLFGYLSFGVGFSVLAHELWPGVPRAYPVWLPIAYERASFDLLYLVCLVIVPIAVVALPAWFLYEVTIANLTSVTDDRSSRLKLWFVVTAPVLVIAASVAAFLAPARERLGFTLGGAVLLGSFLTFATLLFQGDPLGAGAIATTSGSSKHAEAAAIGAFAVYAIAFGVFVTGLGGYLRARISTALLARIALIGILFALSVGPWIVSAIAVATTSSEAQALAAPSPFFAFALAEAVEKGKTGDANFAAGIAAAGVWAVAGVVLLGASARRCRKIIRDHEALLAETDRILAEEDQAAANARDEANAPPPDDAEIPMTDPIPG